MITDNLLAMANRFWSAAFALAAAAVPAFAVQNIAVLEIVSAGNVEISVDENRHLTDALRREAVRAMPNADGYAVLTRDNIIQLLPPDEEEAECLAEGCAVDIGRAIGAEYVSQGRVSRFAGQLSLSVELYETMGGKLLGSIVMESDNLNGILGAIREQSPSLFGKISAPASQPRHGSPPETAGFARDSGAAAVQAGERIDSGLPNSNEAQSWKFPLWAKIGIDVLGAAAIGFGVYQNSIAQKAMDDYRNPGNAQEEFDSSRKKAKDASSLRNAGYVAGGAILAAGIAFHIAF